MQVGGGGDHACPGGGYSGGAGEQYNLGNDNGLGSIYNGDSAHRTAGGYYSYDMALEEENSRFGLGGRYESPNSMGGSGGIAGEGGTIRYSENAKIYAYNGDRISNEDYTSIYKQYDKDGNLTSELAEVKIKPNGDKTIPALIFIQSGIKRSVYNYSWYMSQKILDRYGLTRDTSKFEKVLLEPEKLDVVHSFQGIGSGAGYIEVSNGTYTVDASLN